MHWAAELADPTKLGRAGLRPTLKLATWLGFCGGFLLAYQSSSRASESTIEGRNGADRFGTQCGCGDGLRTRRSRRGT